MTAIPLFQRKAVVTVDTIQFDSLDFQFKVVKTLKPEPNTCELTVYNLTRDHQAQLQQLGQLPASTAKGTPKAAKAVKGVPAKLEAGYEAGTSLIWLGDLRTVQTVRDGADWVTTLSSGDGEKAWQNARLHVPYGPKTSIDTALRAIVRALGVDEGNLSAVIGKIKLAGSGIFPTGAVISGSASRHLIDLARSADLDVSIQDGALQFTDRGKALAGTALELSSGTGLIESPTVDNNGLLSARMLMIPDVRVGGLVVVQSDKVKGNFRIVKATWQGDSKADDWYVDVEAQRY